MKVYLAGPEVFLADAVAVGASKKELCKRFGVEGLYPFDQQLQGVAPHRLAATIFAANVEMIRCSDTVIANLTPFRGIGADVGTVWEVGMAFGLGKPVYGYSNDPRSLFERTANDLERTALETLADNRILHPDGMAIEDFGLADNLMIEQAIVASGGAFLTPRDGKARALDDLALFETCLRALVERHAARRVVSA